MGGKFLRGDHGREISHMLVPYSLFHLGMQTHKHTEESYSA